MSRFFADMRRAGFGTGVSTGKLAAAMVDGLLQSPPAAPPSKELVVGHLGLLGAMSKARDLNAAWNTAKRQVARDAPARTGSTARCCAVRRTIPTDLGRGSLPPATAGSPP